MTYIVDKIWSLLGRTPISLSQNSLEDLKLVNDITGWNFQINERYTELAKKEDENFSQSLSKMLNMHPSPLGINSSKEHAIEVFSALVDNAIDVIKIYDRDISGDLLNEDHVKNLRLKFQNFVQLGDNKRVEILAPKAGKNDNLIKDLEIFAPGKISVHLIPDELEMELSNVLPFYFAVNDANSFRLERRKEGEDKDRQAKFAFNDNDFGSYLNDTFDRIKSKLEMK
jgi:hypothetical protein